GIGRAFGWSPISSSKQMEEMMKREVILLVDADAETARGVGMVASDLQLDVRFAWQTEGDLNLYEGLSDVALIVLDADPGIRAGGIPLEFARRGPALPLILIAGCDESELEPIPGAYRTTHRLRKPVSFEELSAACKRLIHHPEDGACQCDRWGHRCKDCQHE